MMDWLMEFFKNFGDPVVCASAFVSAIVAIFLFPAGKKLILPKLSGFVFEQQKVLSARGKK